MRKKDKQRPSLTIHQTRVLRDYENILNITVLNPNQLFEFAEDDPEALLPLLKSMIDQAVRSDVIFEYTMIDMELNNLLIRHFFGTGKRLQAAKKTKRFKTLNIILQNIYLIQKLTLVRKFKNIPKSIVSKIAAINELRNGLAHTFFVKELKPAKRTYKKYSIFTRNGLEDFHEDIQEIRYFFMPWLRNIVEDEKNQT